ncbi:MAG: CRISPR-associated endonuclease Cas2 [Anaerovibrio sp.]|uniref:CRISPR-associated endonuclease Cas2 n=1 Tax=Anaerovibrio sp. TaxID=1872532 RepID=UPI0025C4EEA9|nr:CRISPR-associated endonuclease Cas2 [Anaerovibrio sp.]MBE6098592.1 CRISPR-associated endonuclease Cas2 [Anaerovibrio sp.]
MRVIVFFDLPTETSEDKREYRKFRKFLLGNGFLMMQQSVYSKLVLNATAANAVTALVRGNCPDVGLVQMLTVTEKQYNNIELVIGENYSEVVNSTDKLVIL